MPDFIVKVLNMTFITVVMLLVLIPYSIRCKSYQKDAIRQGFNKSMKHNTNAYLNDMNA